MKKNVIVGMGLMAIIVVGQYSCLNKDWEEVPVSKHYPNRTLYVGVNSGKEVVVVNNVTRDTIAIMERSGFVEIPKFMGYTVWESGNRLGAKYQTWQTVAFEDSKVGDYDYNDLVVHTKIIQKNQGTDIYIHPIALGSTKDIALGITVDGVDYIITENARRDLFRGRKGFINTYPQLERVKYDSFVMSVRLNTKGCTYGKSLDWFILVDGDVKLYAVSKNYPNIGRPYGLIINNINDGYVYEGVVCGLDWFNYPIENMDIEEVYPAFSSKNESFKETYNIESEGQYPAIVTEDGVTATDECLYAI